MQSKNQRQNNWQKFFVVEGKGAALLGMPDIELLSILNITCNTTIDVPYWCRDINAQMMEEKCYTSKNSNPNQMAANNKDYILDFSMSSPSRDDDQTASIKITEIIESEFGEVFQVYAALTSLLDLQGWAVNDWWNYNEKTSAWSSQLKYSSQPLTKYTGTSWAPRKQDYQWESQYTGEIGTQI